MAVWGDSWSDLKHYTDVARRTTVIWMDGSELGMAPKRIRAKYPVLLWLYQAKSFLDLVRTYTHECIHYAHPEFDNNEGAVEALTVKLLKSPLWVSFATARVGSALLESATKLFKKSGVSIDV